MTTMHDTPMRWLTRAAARAALGLGGACLPVCANPQGLTVAVGSASASASGSTLSVTTSSQAILNWQSFNIGAGEKTVFNQPSPTSIIWNQINDPNPSRIFGGIQANGIVVLANSSGFWFGPDSVVKAASFVATTSFVPPPDLFGGGPWNLTIAPPTASIINYGQVSSAKGGSVFLVAEKVENHGVMTAPDGTLGLYAGKQVLVSERPDGRGLSANVSLPAGSVNNYGKLIADAGQIAMSAQVVNQSGLAQATSVANHNGVIELTAGDDVTLGAGSQTLAQGGAGVSDGGRITVKSGGTYHDSPTAVVSTAGGLVGGNGGQIELSAPDMAAVNARVGAGAGPGGTLGSLSLDPDTITIVSGGTGKVGSGANGATPGALVLDPSAFSGFSRIVLQAKTLISVNSPLGLDNQTGAATLTLQSGGDIQIGQLGNISAGNGWSVSLYAGYLFNSGLVQSGVGSITFAASSFLSTVDGSVSLYAGKDITVGSGYVHTTGGGSITADAAKGTINTGTGVGGYVFKKSTGTGYGVDPAVSGISTAAGGNVVLTAGTDVVSLLPTGSAAAAVADAGSGAFGSQPGDVTITSGRNVLGHFVLANGKGSITAAASAGTSMQLALSLISGAWAVSAKDITLQEVRNPSGALNVGSSASDPNRYRFDYALSDSVTLNAINSVTLLGNNLPRSGAQVPIIYPGTLSINAGVGGVLLGSSIDLAPSPQGQLDIETTVPSGQAGGDFATANTGRTPTLTMSDSAATSYSGRGTQFGPSDHASVPVHQHDPKPVIINLAGNLTDVDLVMPKATLLTVGGNMTDSSLFAQNLRASDVTAVAVAGNIQNRSIFTSYALPAGVPPPAFSVLALAVPPFSVPLYFDPSIGPHGTLFCRGKLTASDAYTLNHLLVEKLDAFGNPIFDSGGQPVLVPAPQILPPEFLATIVAGSANSGNLSAPGIQVGGPGQIVVTAKNIDLGSSPGIVSSGAGYNASLAPAIASAQGKGASISVTTGNLTMFDSAVLSSAGGDLTVTASGSVTVGSTAIPPTANSFVARGIYSTDNSAVTVTAGGDINVNGSRIATYNGGTLDVTSTGGTVNAGLGGLSIQSVTAYVVDPKTGVLSVQQDIIPGSGLLATTYSYGSTTVGDIYVNAPHGDIIARSGGIIQAPFNNTSGNKAILNLSAGSAKNGDDPGFIGAIDASGSVVAGGDVNVKATGPILGFFLASGNLGITTPQNINVTALAGGNATVSAGGTVSGTIVGVGGVSASGSAISANLVSQNVSSSTATTGQAGLGTGNVAAAAGQAAAAGTAAATEKKVAAVESEEDPNKKKRPTLTRTVGRVTVLLPGKPN